MDGEPGGQPLDPARGRSRGAARNRNAISAALEAFLSERTQEMEARIAAWVGDYQPRNSAELFLVQQAARLSWKLDRLNEYETAVLSARVRDAVRRVDEARRERLDAAMEMLLARRESSGGDTDTDVEDIREVGKLIRELERAAEGCDRLIRRWRTLRDTVQRGDSWTDEDERVAACLLGSFRGEWVDSDLAEFLIANQLMRDAQASRGPMAERSIPSSEWRALGLEGTITHWLTGIDRVLGRLQALRVDRERDDSAEKARKMAADLASFDPSPEGERLRRCQHSTHREFLKAVEALSSLRSRKSRDG